VLKKSDTKRAFERENPFEMPDLCNIFAPAFVALIALLRLKKIEIF
jgi:hypothetical protein